MNNIPSTSSALVEQLLADYSREHPFRGKPEHTSALGLLTEHYYEDVATYSQNCCEWVQKQMQERNIPIQLYRLLGLQVKASSRYNLLVENTLVLHNVSYQAAEDYVFQTMTNHDLYCEAHMTEPLSGRNVREHHNAMEAKYAEDGTYTPQFSYEPGPYTSERRAFE